ncbi:helix-turn-helix transcriptional regulator (plasmid) [Devosia sp. A8/3-2]|nr:helix-turn-helix transcriptional regulator [Devosia sp. A8/3-2]
MGYKSEHLVSQVREVREASGLSQRALSERTGQTQSHISQIESGKMEPWLSSFIDMARALDLELVLVPKKLVPSVAALMRSQATPEMHVHAGHPNDKRLARRAPCEEAQASLWQLGRPRPHRGVPAFPAPHKPKRSGDAVGAWRDGPPRTLPGSPQADPVVHDIAQTLQRLRNSVAPGVPSEPRPAYALDDGDENA